MPIETILPSSFPANNLAERFERYTLCMECQGGASRHRQQNIGALERAAVDVTEYLAMKRIMVAFVLFGAAHPALACGVCTASIVDSFAPPVQGWILLAFTWFLTHGAIRTLTRAPLPAQPGLLGSIGLGLAAAVLGLAIAGPLVVPFLMIPPLVATFLALGSNPFPGRLAVRIAGGLHVAALLASLAMSAYILRTRTEGEFIVQWEGAAMGISHLHQLQKDEPRSLPTYRYLLEHGSSRLIAKAVERIAVVGSPEVDIPLLEKALRRSSNEPQAAESITAALAALKRKTESVE